MATNQKKISLLKQAEIESKKRQMSVVKGGYKAKEPLLNLLNRLLPAYTFKPKQVQFINAKQLVAWYLGGYKSGKSFTGVCLDIALAYINRPYPGILVHPTMDGNEITVLPLIDEICTENGIEYEVKKLSTKFKVVFKFGMDKRDWGVLLVASGDKPKSLKGPKLAFGHIDEPLVMKEEITEVIISRLAEMRATLRRLLYTGTPEPEHMQWGFDIVDKEFEDSEDRFITTMSTREVAEFLAPGYIEGMVKNLSPERVETFVDGKYRNLSQGKVYQSFNKKTCVMDAALIKNYKDAGDSELVIGVDFNVNQMSGTLTRLSGRYKLQLKEFRIQSRSDTRELARLMINRLFDEGYLIRETGKKLSKTKYGRSLIITGDASGKAHSSKSNQSDYEIIQQEFEAAGVDITIFVPDANPAVRDRVNYINMQFENETYFVSSDCPITIRDRELTSWKLGADGFFVDKSKKELTHLGDAADYPVYNTQMLTEDPDHRMNVMTWERGKRR